MRACVRAWCARSMIKQVEEQHRRGAMPVVASLSGRKRWMLPSDMSKVRLCAAGLAESVGAVADGTAAERL